MTDKTEIKQNKSRRSIIGRVASSKMDKTVSVAVDRLIKHPIYGKYIRRTTKILAHDNENKCNEGDRVTIRQCKPIAKNKSWYVVDIVNSAPEK